MRVVKSGAKSSGSLPSKAEIGLLPAAGSAMRLWPYRNAKELFPVGYVKRSETPHDFRPKAVSEYCLDRFKSAGISHCYFIISDHKPEILRYFGNGQGFGIHVGYLHQRFPSGLANAIDTAFPWTRDAVVFMGLPDTVVFPDNAYSYLKESLYRSSLDLMLGIFPTETPELLGPVRMDDNGRILEIQDKPEHPTLCNTWGIAAWGPVFTEFLHSRLEKFSEQAVQPPLGAFFQEAVDNGLHVRGHYFKQGTFMDIGTPSGILHAKRLMESFHLEVPAGVDRPRAVSKGGQAHFLRK